MLTTLLRFEVRCLYIAPQSQASTPVTLALLCLLASMLASAHATFSIIIRAFTVPSPSLMHILHNHRRNNTYHAFMYLRICTTADPCPRLSLIRMFSNFLCLSGLSRMLSGITNRLIYMPSSDWLLRTDWANRRIRIRIVAPWRLSVFDCNN
jgi:hypothetical protein